MEINEKAFGKNDLRGIYNESITPELFYYVAKGYVKYAMQKTGKEARDIWVTVARDARHHSLELVKSLKKGIISSLGG